MLLVLLTLALLMASLVVPAMIAAARRRRSRRPRSRRRRPSELVALGDPGRERRAEQRARELMRSCVNEEEWEMYRDLGFVRVFGRGPDRAGIEGARGGEADGRRPAAPFARGRPSRPPAGGEGSRPEESPAEAPRYAYLIYPHKPILAYEHQSRRLLSEYCVEFPDLSDAVTGSRLPDSDDVLAKWMALTGDEGRLLRDANMHLPGRQLDPGRVRRDLWRLEE
ncbi:MAG: hypothetical protein M3088_06530, partial [Actinomycetota bacterium]|nr:hypothetical protein [Actinomycetota bacterium]